MEMALNPDKFELEDIVEPQNHWVAKHFACGACARIPLNPVLAPASAECGHVFCDSCSNAPWCELCEKGLPSAERPPLSQGIFIAKCYAELPVRCPHWSAHSKLGASEGWDSSFGETDTCADDQETTDGEKETADKEEQVRHFAPLVPEKLQCGWKGIVQDLRSHLLECPFQFIQCPSGTVFRRKDTENHRQTECLCTFENCPVCDERVKVGTMEHHRAEKAKEHATLLEEKLKEREIDLEKSKTDGAVLKKKLEEREKDAADLEKKLQERDFDLEKSKTDAAALKEKVEEREIHLKKCKKGAARWMKKVKERETDLKKCKEGAATLEKKVKEQAVELEKSTKRASDSEKKVEEQAVELEKSTKRASDSEKKVEERDADLQKCRDDWAQQSKDVSTFEWEIKNPVEVKAEHPEVDDQAFSPEFFLRGLGPWTVSIKPSGDSREPGGVGVFLWGSASTASARVEARLTINGVSRTLPERVYSGSHDSARGWSKLPGLAWPATNDKPVRVQVEFLKVTPFAITK